MPKNPKANVPRTSTPMRARVQESAELGPLTVSLDGKTLAVVAIDERVEEEVEWWEPEPVFKMHYQVTLEDGQQVEIFRNMKTGSWYRAL
jgi:hypothetical protein